MGRQSEIFLKGEGRAWLKRNIDKVNRENDPVIAAIREAKIRPRKVYEIGAANGWRLEILRNEFECTAYGSDPGASQFDAWVDCNTAEGSQFNTGAFDVVIYGFCLYLCDREDLFNIVAEGDRVLADGGYLIIWDFEPEAPCKVPYHHHDGIYSYKMNYARLWLANPAYSLFHKKISGVDTTVAILKKNLAGAWPTWTP